MSEDKDRCERECKGIRLTYEPLPGCKVSACMQCGYVHAEYNGNVVYETYQSFPILVGFSSEIIKAIKRVIDAKS